MNIYSFDKKAALIREFSVDAAILFKDEFFDWVFLDADHKYEAVKEDLVTWFPKIKKGGIFCGHDYLNSDKEHNGHTDFGVKKAVDEWAVKNNLRINTTTQEIFPFWWVQV